MILAPAHHQAIREGSKAWQEARQESRQALECRGTALVETASRPTTSAGSVSRGLVSLPGMSYRTRLAVGLGPAGRYSHPGSDRDPCRFIRLMCHGVAQGLRRRRQAQRVEPSAELGRLQAALGCRRRRDTGQLPADLGLRIAHTARACSEQTGVRYHTSPKRSTRQRMWPRGLTRHQTHG